MELLIYIIPILVSLGFLVFKAKETVWWEYLLLIGGSVLLAFLLKQIITGIKTSDTEYLSGYVTQTTYYEPWNEEVEVTKTRTNSEGEEETYTETETRYHSAEYSYRTNMKRSEVWCSRDYHEALKKQFRVSGVFRDMHRHYYTQDGDAYDYFWDGTDETMKTLTETGTYRNQVKGSMSIFRMGREDSTLFDYPVPEKRGDQKVVLGNAKYDSRPIQILNAKLGKQYQVHIFVLLFYNEGPEIAERQKEYWEGGNKNELVVCLGMKRDSIQWCSPFSWSESPVVETRIKSWCLENPRLRIKELAAELERLVKENWKRREFKDFNYIETELRGGDYIIILVLVLVYIVGIGIWITKNEYRNLD